MAEDELWIEYVPLSKLKEWERNPKLHAEEDISDSIDTYGFTDPITLDEASGKIVSGMGRRNVLLRKHKEGEDPPDKVKIAGDGTWLVPVIRGNSFKDKEAVESYLLTVNRLVEKGGWNENLLENMVEQLRPIGFDIVERAKEIIDSHPVETPNIGPPPQVDISKPSTPTQTSAEIEGTDFEDVPGVLRGVWDINEVIVFPIENQYGIPHLREDMLLEELPSPIKTWAGQTVTPDDGSSWYLFSYGAAPTRGIPYSRTIICWFTHDSHIETWWNAPSYRVGQMLRSGLQVAVVPDVSIWEAIEIDGVWYDTPPALQIYAVYRAQWLGRFFQEAGLKVIPRFEYFLPQCREFSMLGVPVGAPVMATQLHTKLVEDDPRIKQALIEGVEKFRPGQLLVYASEKGANIVDDCKLPCEVVIVPTVKRVAKPKESYKETDPYLIELRKRKKGRERTKSTGGK